MPGDYGDATQLPAIPAVGDDNLVESLVRVKEILEVWRGSRGDGLDKVVTIRDLLNSGALNDLATKRLIPVGTFPEIPTPDDPAIPPTPTDLKASGALQNIIVDWVFPIEYTRLSHFEVWRSETDALGDAALIAQPGAPVYSDEVGPDKAYYYWVRAVSDAGISPFNAIAGTLGTTAIDTAAALEALDHAITESQLYATLGARINLIDGPDTLAGSVAQRIKAEADARIAAVTAEANARVAAVNQEATDRANALAAEAAARGTAISDEATLRQTGDDSLAEQISLVTAGVAGGFDYGKVWYFDAGVEGWTSTGATQTPNNGWVDVDSAGADPAFISPSGLAVAGATYPIVKARIKRLAGSTWDGTCYYVTGGHGVSDLYKKTIPAPSPFEVGDVAIVEFAMNDLTAGGTDWTSNSISQIRLDFGADATDTISVDWVAIGRNAPGASVAGLLTEQQARISGDAANATNITALTARMTTAESNIVTEQTARADGDAANASDITALTARMDDAEANIVTEQTARADGDSALSSQISSVSAVANAKNTTYRQPAAPTLNLVSGDLWFDTDDNNRAYRYDGTQWVATDDARIATNAANLLTEQTARANGDSANADSISVLTTRVGNAETSISTEQSARSDADAALSTQINDVSAVANAKNKTYRQPAAPATGLVLGDIWFDTDDNNKAYRYDGTQWVATDDARIAANAAAIISEQTARADGDTANANAITALSATVDDNTAAITAEQTARANGDTANANDIAALSATVDDNTAAITAEQTARANGDSALTSQINTVSATAASKARVFVQNTAPTTGRSVNDLWYDTANGNRAQRWNGSSWVDIADNRISSNTAAIQTEQTARADADSALSSQINTLQVTVNGHTVSIQNEITARADADGYLGAQYTLRVDVNGIVGGYGVSGTASGSAGPEIDFGIRANRFFIAPPAGSGNTKTAAFVYQATATTVNGESRPAGLYLSDAFIANGVITNAKISDLAVDSAKIANLAVTNGKIANLAVTTAKLADLSVTTAKIVDAAINSAKIASAAVGTAEIANLAVTTAKVADLNVTSGKIADLAVTAAKIANLAVTNGKIANLSVSTLKIADAAVTVPVFGSWWRDVQGPEVMESNFEGARVAVSPSFTVDVAANVMAVASARFGATGAEIGKLTLMLSGWDGSSWGYPPGTGVTTSSTGFMWLDGPGYEGTIVCHNGMAVAAGTYRWEIYAAVSSSFTAHISELFISSWSAKR